jgi:hypothetical protein
VTLTSCKSPWEVPEGFASYEFTQEFHGVIGYKKGQPIYGDAVYHWGVQHIYDDGELRIVVRPGNRERYSCGGYYMEIESLAGKPGQQFPNVESALAAAHDELIRWPRYREMISAAAVARSGRP